MFLPNAAKRRTSFADRIRNVAHGHIERSFDQQDLKTQISEDRFDFKASMKNQ
ncbi:MAG: hypothetical protein ACKO56_06035 [Paracoccaceae bacterium]